MNEWRKNLRFIFKTLVFVFGILLMIFANELEFKMFGLVFVTLSLQ